jgi:uncharacterized protein (TIGR02996 family)
VTSEQQALLRAVIDRPDDDAPRLVYADWLDDHGRAEPDRARAAFIRLQVEAARLDEYDPRRLDLEGQAEALLNAVREHGEPRAWLAGVEDRGVNHHYSSFERGFPTVVNCTVNELLDRGDALWAAAPFCRLGLSPNWQPGGEDRFPALARWPHLAHLRTLRLWGVPSSVEALAPLLASPLLARLEHLDLSPPADQPWLEALLASPLRQRLTGLGLATFHPWGSVRTLVNSGLLGRLRNLHFQGRPPSPWTAEASQALAAGPTDRLESLAWGMANLAGPALRALTAAPPLKRLKSLSIVNNNFRPADLAALTEWLASDRLPSLEALHIGYCNLRAADAAALAACPGLARLLELDLTGGGLSNNGARALAASPHLTNLRVLRLESNGLQSPGALALAESPHLQGLRVLDLSWNPVPVKARKALHRLRPDVVRC